MIQTIVFYGGDEVAKRACNKAALEANQFLKTFEIDKEHLVSSTTNFQTTFSESHGTSISECIITLVVDIPYTIIDLLPPTQEDTAEQEQEQADGVQDNYPF